MLILFFVFSLSTAEFRISQTSPGFVGNCFLLFSGLCLHNLPSRRGSIRRVFRSLPTSSTNYGPGAIKPWIPPCRILFFCIWSYSSHCKALYTNNFRILLAQIQIWLRCCQSAMPASLPSAALQIWICSAQLSEVICVQCLRGDLSQLWPGSGLTRKDTNRVYQHSFSNTPLFILEMEYNIESG